MLVGCASLFRYEKFVALVLHWKMDGRVWMRLGCIHWRVVRRVILMHSTDTLIWNHAVATLKLRFQHVAHLPLSSLTVKLVPTRHSPYALVAPILISLPRPTLSLSLFFQRQFGLTRTHLVFHLPSLSTTPTIQRFAYGRHVSSTIPLPRSPG